MRKQQAELALPANSTKPYGRGTILKQSQKTEEKRILPIHVMIPKSNKLQTSNSHDQRCNISKKKLAESIEQYVKIIKHHDQMGFITVMQSWLDIQNSISISHYVNYKRKIRQSSQQM